MRSRMGSKNLKEEIKDIGEKVPIIKHRERSSSLILDQIEQVVSGAILNSTNRNTPLKQKHSTTVFPTGSQQNLKSDVFFHCLHFAVGVVTFMWGVRILYAYIFQASLLKNETKKESNFVSWIIKSKSDWQSFSLLCIIGSVYTITALTSLGMLFHSTFGFDFLNYLPYFYDSGQYPKLFSSNFVDQRTLSHSERVEHEKHASILASVPYNDQLHLKPQQPDNISKNKNKNTAFIKPRRLIQPGQNSAADSRILSPLSLSKVDVGSDSGLGGLLKENKFDGPSSDIDFVDGLWHQRIQRFRSGLNRQQVFQDQFNEQYKLIHDHYPPSNFHQRYLLCRPCYNRFNCHHLHVNYRGYRYHCQPYDMNFGPPRQKMSQIQVYKNNYMILELLESRGKDSALTWSAPNDYPGRNLHEFISKKFPPVPDNIDNAFQPLPPLRSVSKQAEWDRIKNERAVKTRAMRYGRFCPINDPCIVHKEKRKSSYRNGNILSSTLNGEVSKLRRSKIANRRMNKRLIPMSNATNIAIEVDADADGDSEDDENVMITARTSVGKGKSDSSECDSDDGETWTNLDGPRVIYVNHSFDYTR